MARFFFYDELVHLERPPIEDIQWLSGQIAHLPPFVEGSAVLCGSVSWGNHSWRSDLDVAHFSTIEHPHINKLLEDVINQYNVRTHNQFITPWFDVITIGAQSISLVNVEKSVSASPVSGGVPKKTGRVSDVFMETAVLFTDHIASIAKLKGGPWRVFLDRYLSPIDRSKFDQREALKNYVERMTTEWSRQPLHQLNLDPRGITPEQLDLLSKSENYPINLMRRILGYLGRYPSPDRAPDVRAAFSMLPEPWAARLLTQFEPFFLIEQKYEQIVAACRHAETPVSPTGYHEQLRSLFSALPFVDIQNIIWEVFGGS